MIDPRTIADLNAFVPAKDLELAKRFYGDLGFSLLWSNDEIAQVQAGAFRFLLQKFYVKDHAGNFMMSLAVEDADVWWQHIVAADLQRRYDLSVAKPPAMQPWGIRVLYLSDPTGVLWHITDKKPG